MFLRFLQGLFRSSRPKKALRGNRYRRSGSRLPWIIPCARSSGVSALEQGATKSPVRARNPQDGATITRHVARPSRAGNFPASSIAAGQMSIVARKQIPLYRHICITMYW